MRSRHKPVPDKFENSQYLFPGLGMDTIGRSYKLITPGSQRVHSRDEIISFY